MRVWIFLLLTLSLIPPAYPYSGYGVEVTLQSPLMQETDAGTIVTATFLVTNHTDKKENFLPILELPTGWDTIPFEEPFFSLEPGETRLELFAFRVPANTPSGTYSIKFTARGQQNPSLMSEASFSVYVLGNSSISSFIKNSPSHALAGDPYFIELQVANQGNIENTITVSVEDHLEFPISIEPESFLLLPGEKRDVTIKVHPSDSYQKVIDHFLTIFIKSDDETLESLITKVELFPKTVPKLERYEYIPMKTAFGYGRRNDKAQLFIEQQGGGPLGNGRNIDFFLRAPLISETNVDRDLGGPPEDGYIHYYDKFTDAYGGDGVYSITPLTMLNRFGRGGSLSIKPGRFLLKGVYVHDSSSVPQSSFGGSLSYKPIDPLSFSLSSMRTLLKNKSQEILDIPRKTLTNSILGRLDHPTAGEATLEYADTGGFFTTKKHKQSYYLYARGSPKKNFWYALQGIYSEPKFSGYYQDTAQFYTSIGFPIIYRLQGTLAHNIIRYNLQKDAEKKTAPRIFSSYGGLSYSFPSGFYASLYYNQDSSRDKISDQGYRTRFFSLNGGQSFQKWTVQGIIDYGKFHPIETMQSNRVWQNYQLYAYYQPTARKQFAFYTRIGYEQLYKEINWAYIYGVSTTFSTKKNIDLQFLYEFTDQTNNRHYLSSKAKYTFSNQSFLQLKGFWNKVANQNATVEFLLSYTIPWRLPIAKNKKAGIIKGTASYQETDSTKPAPSLVVNCNGMRTLTNAKGEFAFPALKPGEYHLWTEEKSHEKVSTTPLPISVDVKGGEAAKIDLCFDHPCSLSGKMPIFQSSKEGADISGYANNAPLILRSAKTNKTIYTTTNQKGEFFFDKLSPGRWILQIHPRDLPQYHYIEQDEILIDLFPGEDRALEIKILPIKRELRIIDTDTVYPTAK